ncbi:MAG: hypothetical protein LBU86_04400 [Oscillospiraceae bacterium]|nr:hypothetical protein [Oscillospiraceae bacterium]
MKKQICSVVPAIERGAKRVVQVFILVCLLTALTASIGSAKENVPQYPDLHIDSVEEFITSDGRPEVIITPSRNLAHYIVYDGYGKFLFESTVDYQPDINEEERILALQEVMKEARGKKLIES